MASDSVRAVPPGASSASLTVANATARQLGILLYFGGAYGAGFVGRFLYGTNPTLERYIQIFGLRISHSNLCFDNAFCEKTCEDISSGALLV